VAVVTSAFSLLSLMICFLSAINIAHALMAALRARQREIGIMRAVGATQADIRRLVLLEGGLLGLYGGILGGLGAAGTAWAVDKFATGVLPPFPFQPESFFSFPVWLWPFGGVLGLVAAMLGAYGPARHASSQEPARVLAG
jgi:ABC-type antimicrobial peptide transport system permease subunit